MEVINNLLNYNRLKIVQDTESFKFSLDSVLLANFVKINKKTKKIIDLCTGNIPIPLIFSKEKNLEIYGVEIQKKIIDLAKKTIKINNINNINLINDDIKNLGNYFETDTFDIVTCNPPFFKYSETSNISKSNSKSLARHEIEINLTQILQTARKILKNNGYLYIVQRTERLVEVLECMRKNNIEPKIIQFVFPKASKESNIVLIAGSKNGKSGVKILKPFIVHNNDGTYKKKILKIFDGRKQI